MGKRSVMHPPLSPVTSPDLLSLLLVCEVSFLVEEEQTIVHRPSIENHHPTAMPARYSKDPQNPTKCMYHPYFWGTIGDIYMKKNIPSFTNNNEEMVKQSPQTRTYWKGGSSYWKYLDFIHEFEFTNFYSLACKARGSDLRVHYKVYILVVLILFIENKRIFKFLLIS
jgi:hypothetical protein